LHIHPETALDVHKFGKMEIAFTDGKHAHLLSGGGGHHFPGLKWRGKAHYVSIHVYTDDGGKTWTMGDERLTAEDVRDKNNAHEVRRAVWVGVNGESGGTIAFGKAVMDACNEQMTTPQFKQYLLEAEVESCRDKEQETDEACKEAQKALDLAAKAHRKACFATLDAIDALNAYLPELSPS